MSIPTSLGQGELAAMATRHWADTCLYSSGRGDAQSGGVSADGIANAS